MRKSRRNATPALPSKKMRNPGKKGGGKKKAKKPKAKDALNTGSALVDVDDIGDEMMEEEEDEPGEAPKVWRPGVDGMEEDETLVYDPSAYDCLHALRLEWPCLSFDIVRDDLGDKRSAFPHTSFIVAGTQASSSGENCLAVVRMANLTKMKQPSSDDEDEESSDEEGDEESAPRMHTRLIKHHGGINRTRAMPQQPSVVATWGDNGYVQVWDVAAQLQQVAAEAAEGAKTTPPPAKAAPRHCFTGHKEEGFAMDWSTMTAGRMVTGDCAKAIHLWEPGEAGRWAIQANSPYTGHEDSVEDLQWSPSEATVFASCGVDGTVRIWDTRHPQRQAALTVKCHNIDVNVISWNRHAGSMVASGADDGMLRVWDLRAFKEGGAVAEFTYNRGPITSVEWSPFDSSILAASSADQTLCIWDLSVERDAEDEAAVKAAGELEGTAQIDADELPPQLMFVHQGQQDIKELHWHGQIPGVIISTAADGFNVFKPSNI